MSSHLTTTCIPTIVSILPCLLLGSASMLRNGWERTIWCPSRACLATVDAKRPSMCARASMITSCNVKKSYRWASQLHSHMRLRSMARTLTMVAPRAIVAAGTPERKIVYFGAGLRPLRCCAMACRRTMRRAECGGLTAALRVVFMSRGQLQFQTTACVHSIDIVQASSIS